MFNTLPKSESYTRILLRGGDSIDFAQRLFTRDLRRISEGEARLSLFLTADAKVIGLFWLLKVSPQELQLWVSSSQSPRLLEKLHLFHFSEELEIQAAGEGLVEWAAWSTELGASLDEASGKIQSNGRLLARWRNSLFRFSESPSSTDPTETSATEWALHRISSLIPKEPEDYNETDLCLKLGFMDLCDENKGCYAGQEIIERVRTRSGGSPEVLACVYSPDAILLGGEKLSLHEKAAGNLTRSIVAHPENGSLALAFLKRNFLSEKQFKTAPGQDLTLISSL
jgi:folate-binding protein YgfZ